MAQETVSITTEYDEPYKNTWSGGIYAGLDVQNNSGGIYTGINARYTLGKIATFSTNIAYDLTKIAKSGGILKYDEEVFSKLPAYKNIEFRGVFHFSDKEGSMDNKIKLGQVGDMKYSTSYKSKSRLVYGLTASINIQSRISSQTLDSVKIFTVKDNQGNNPGFVNGITAGQNNLVLGAGIHIGQYTWFKGKFTAAPIGSKTRRARKTISTNFEFLTALAIGTGDKAYHKKDANSPLITYTLTDTEKKRFGFRITADVSSNKPGLFNRVEMGWRPGIYAPNKQTKYFNQAYFLYAIGIGF